MALINASHRLSDIIADEPSIIPVLNRFGITLGTADLTVETACRRFGLDTQFILAILNTLTIDDYFPEKHLKRFDPLVIIEYLKMTDLSYLKYQLTNIDRHFESLIQRSGDKNNLKLIRTFYDELKADVTASLNNDISNWFTQIKRLHDGADASSEQEITRITDLSEIEDKIGDLRNMFIIHLHGEYDVNLCYAVIVAIVSFEKDFRRNNRIRNRILMPLYKAMFN